MYHKEEVGKYLVLYSALSIVSVIAYFSMTLDYCGEGYQHFYITLLKVDSLECILASIIVFIFTAFIIFSFFARHSFTVLIKATLRVVSLSVV